MKEKLQKIKEAAISQLKEASSLEALNEVRLNFLGKKGELTAVLKSMKDVAPEDRPKVGQWVNETREAIESTLVAKIAKLEARLAELDAILLQPEKASDMKLVNEYTEVQQQLDAEMEQWGTLGEELEAFQL